MLVSPTTAREQYKNGLPFKAHLMNLLMDCMFPVFMFTIRSVLCNGYALLHMFVKHDMFSSCAVAVCVSLGQ